MSESESRALQDMSLYTQSVSGSKKDKEAFERLHRQSMFSEILPAKRMMEQLAKGEADVRAVYTDGLFIGVFAALTAGDDVLLVCTALEENCRSRGYAGRLLSAVKKTYWGRRIIVPALEDCTDDDGLPCDRQAFYRRNDFRWGQKRLITPQGEFPLLSCGGFDAEALARLLPKEDGWRLEDC